MKQSLRVLVMMVVIFQGVNGQADPTWQGKMQVLSQHLKNLAPY